LSTVKVAINQTLPNIGTDTTTTIRNNRQNETEIAVCSFGELPDLLTHHCLLTCFMWNIEYASMEMVSKTMAKK
jgi:hypothetical protein